MKQYLNFKFNHTPLKLPNWFFIFKVFGCGNALWVRCETLFIARLSCTHIFIWDKPNTKWDMNASMKIRNEFELKMLPKHCKLSNACEYNKHNTIEFNIHYSFSIFYRRRGFQFKYIHFEFRLDGKSTFWMLICSIHKILSDSGVGFIFSICFFVFFFFQISLISAFDSISQNRRFEIITETIWFGIRQEIEMISQIITSDLMHSSN